MSLHIIKYFTHWFNLHLERKNDPSSKDYLPLESHARWIFALLTRVDSWCTADEMSGLRALTRACLSLLRVRRPRNERVTSPTPGDATPSKEDSDEVPMVDPTSTKQGLGSADSEGQNCSLEMSDASIWLITCAVAGFWGQRDLWDDATDAIAPV